MDINLAILLAMAAVWLTAGVIAEGLPGIRSARALQRRLAIVLVLVVIGLAAMTGAGLVALVTATPGPDQLVGALALPAVPASAVAFVTVRRLRRLRHGAAAFATAPHVPAPPTLRAGAAHPMVALPVQLTALGVLPAAVTAAGVLRLTGAAMIGPVLTAAAIGAAVIGVHHALRHSRLSERAVTRSATAVHVLRV
ncbi:hypothetical protein [Micromonospora sp. NPDC049679]|uniref:hypothetical protein n=1 Tax=Micromonospora sp. NPDC049679 TaxID=3155920 RepID=UPI0033EBED8C